MKEHQPFDTLANEWWQLDGKFRSLHQVNPVRLKFISSHTELQNREVLDVGCGGGIFAESLAKQGAQVTAIDVSKESIKIARDHAQSEKLTIDYQCRSLDSLAADSSESFDVVFCLEMLEHTPNPDEIFVELCEQLKPNGLLFISSLNRNFKSWLLSIVIAEKLLKWIPAGTHNAGMYLKPQEIAQLARLNGLNLVDSSGIIWHPLKRQFQLSKNDLDVNYIMAFSKSS